MTLRRKIDAPAQGRASLPLIAGLVLVLWVTGGCSRLRTDYGPSKGATGHQSLNGFGALRNSYQQAGFRCRDVGRLTNRVARTDTIVWTPQLLTPIGTKVTQWFDRWLRRGGRTLVYIVPDSGSEADYWIDAGKLAPPPQRLEYRKRAAKSINARMSERMNRHTVKSNGWFSVEPLVMREQLGEIGGSWGGDLNDAESTAVEAAIEYRITAYDEAAAQANAAAAGAPAGPFWVGAEVSTTNTPIEFETLLRNESGDPVVVELTSDKWRQSRILVVSGGSLLTNYAFTRAFNRRLADRIVAASTPSGDDELSAGFLTTDWSQVVVSERQPGVPTAAGMELLTVWPLSAVTIHAVLLGFVIGLAIWPSFGRPRRVRRVRHNDFADHLDAIAGLMSRAGGETFARWRISEYFKRVRGETSGRWVLPEADTPVGGAVAPQPQAPLPNLPPPVPSPPAVGPPAANETLGTPAVTTTPTANPTSPTDTAESPTLPLTVDPLPLTMDVVGSGDDAKQIFSRFLQLHFEARGMPSSLDGDAVRSGDLRLEQNEVAVQQRAAGGYSYQAAIETRWFDSERRSVAFVDWLFAHAGSYQEAVTDGCDLFVAGTLPPLEALRSPNQHRGCEVRELDRWIAYVGQAQVRGLSLQSFPDTLRDEKLLQAVLASDSADFAAGAIHACGVTCYNRDEFVVVCTINGRRSDAAEQFLRQEFFRHGPEQEEWLFRQFFTLRTRESASAKLLQTDP